MAAGAGAGSPVGRTARTSRRRRPGCRAGRTAAPARRRPAASARPERERLARAGRRRARGRSGRRSRWRPCTTSYGPTETPPDDDRAGPPRPRGRVAAAPRRRRGRRSRSRGRCASAPARADQRRRPGPLASGIPAGPSGSPGARTSSPVARIATRGFRCTRSVSTPAPASRAMVAAPIAVPGSTSVAPSIRSLPADRTEPPGLTTSWTSTGGGQRSVASRPREPAAGSVQRRCGLDRDHGIGACRHAGPCGDAHGRAGSDLDVGREAGPHLASDLEPCRCVLGRVGGIGGLDRVSVHRRVRPRRQRRPRDSGLGHHPAQGGLEAHAFGAGRPG